jgi:3'-5' exoribonuclease
MKEYYSKNMIDLIGQEISEYFYLKDISDNYNTTGKTWSNCIFADCSGTLRGVIWSQSMNNEYQSYKGKVVKAQGTVALKDGSPCFTVVHMQLVEQKDYSLDDFIYQLDDTVFNEYKNQIIKYIESIHNKTLGCILHAIYTDKMFINMRNLPAGISYHHTYNGGLLAHILETTTIADSFLTISEIYSNGKSYYMKPDRDLVIAGALLNDIGKVFEYTPFPMAAFTKSSKLIGFITEGNNLLTKAFSECDKVNEEKLDKEIFKKLQHIVMSTHATKKSGVLPLNKEAIIVANADRASTDIDGYDTTFHLYDNSHPNNSEEVFSQYFNRIIIR